MRLIDADEAYKVLADYFHTRTEIQHKALKEAFERVPTVDAEPVRHGHWIEGNNFHWYSNSCSCCGYTRTTDIKSNGWNQWKYCPMCGAKMDERREDDT